MGKETKFCLSELKKLNWNEKKYIKKRIRKTKYNKN